MKKIDIKPKAKKAVIFVAAGAAAVAIVAGAFFGLRGRGEPVGVYPFSMVGMTEFWGDNQESYGPVTTDRIQTVFLSDTQTITEVLVQEGDTVKKGDVLMRCDTTLSRLQLERKGLDVERANLKIQEAQEELARISQMDPMEAVDEEVDYSEEFAKLWREQEKKLKELTASAIMIQTEYNLMLREFSDGNIRATLDGQVVSLVTEEESRDKKLPMIKVSGGGGFYVQGSVSELEKDNLKLGQEVTVNDWNTGNMYTGTVESIGEFPTQGDGWNGMGNPNASYYPFRVFIDGSANLQEGSYVSVTYSAAEAENGVYLENPFLRTDDGAAYVYVRGKNGRLEKRTVTTGKSLWGSYTEIRSGLTAEDYVAFPYGKNVKSGAATVESDLSSLYGY